MEFYSRSLASPCPARRSILWVHSQYERTTGEKPTRDAEGREKPDLTVIWGGKYLGLTYLEVLECLVVADVVVDK